MKGKQHGGGGGVVKMTQLDRLTIEDIERTLMRFNNGQPMVIHEVAVLTQLAATMRENERLLAFIETCRNFDPTIEDIKGYPNKKSDND